MIASKFFVYLDVKSELWDVTSELRDVKLKLCNIKSELQDLKLELRDAKSELQIYYFVFEIICCPMVKPGFNNHGMCLNYHMQSMICVLRLHLVSVFGLACSSEACFQWHKIVAVLNLLFLSSGCVLTTYNISANLFGNVSVGRLPAVITSGHTL